jgi:DNA repair protein RadA/Sms
MPKVKSVFVCQSCGAEYAKWQGQCSACNQWNSLSEELREKTVRSSGSLGGKKSFDAKVVSYQQVRENPSVDKARLTTGMEEFDRVLGGGIVPGSVVLVGGEPGIGKSTLLTQLAMKIGQGNSKQEIGNTKQARNSNSKSQDKAVSKLQSQAVLYVCGEESSDQVALRIQRLDRSQNSKFKIQSLLMLASTDVDAVVAAVEEHKPAVVIVDSIQTMSTGDLTGMAGSVGQVRESAFRLIELAKKTGSSVFMVGHVTKEGAIAGPKVLEHMVDAVLTLEGERTGLWRILRSYKNRFGPTDEVGVFEQAQGGMVEVTNPSKAFLEDSQQGKPGSVIVVVMEGTRPVLVEVQALTVKSQLAMPRRVVNGVSLNRVQLLAAVLTKQCGMRLGEQDIFVNVVGGLKMTEPAADLGIALAIASSLKNQAIPKGTVVVGEVGLLGEIRRVVQVEKREKEAKKLGYSRVITPDHHSDVKGLVKKLFG